MFRLKVVEDHIDEGGIPSSIEQWRNLFDFYVHLRNREESCISQSIGLCSACTSCFQFKPIDDKVQLVTKLCSRSLQARDYKERGENVVRLEATRWDKSAISKMFFSGGSLNTLPNTVLKVVDNNCSENMAPECSTSDRDSESKHLGKEACQHFIDQGSKSVLKINEKRFFWMINIDLSKLLTFLYFCEGLQVLFNFLKAYDEIRNLLSSEDWRWLVGIKVFDADRHKFVQSKEVVSKLLEEFDITSIVDLGQEEAPKSFWYRAAPGKESTNLIVAIDGNCPCCLLPLKSRVSDSQQFVTAFSCGHAYHKVCLRHNAAWKCIRCENSKVRRQERNASRISSMSTTSQKKFSPLQLTKVNIRMPNSH